MKIKKLLSILVVAALACTALASCNSIENNENNAGVVAPSAASGALTYIGLRINPEIEMVTDETGTVVSANAVNEDGEVVLSAVELEGQTAEDATVAFTETAVELGYMDPAAGKDTVYVDVQGENAEVKEKVEKSLSDKLMKFFEKKGITGKVSKEVLDTYIAAAEEWNLTPGHAKIVARVLSANPELTYDQLLNLTVKDLLALLKAEKHEDKICVHLKDEYKDKIDDIKDEYEDSIEDLEDAIEDIEEKLEEEELTDEEKAALEKELAEKKAALKTLEDELKAKIDAVKAEYKEFSKQTREECRKEADERKQAKKDGKDFDDDDDDDDDDDEDDEDDDEDDDDKDDDKKGDDKKDDDRGDKKEDNRKDIDDDNDDDDDDDDDKRGDRNQHGKGEKPTPDNTKETVAA